MLLAACPHPCACPTKLLTSMNAAAEVMEVNAAVAALREQLSALQTD